MQAAAPTVEAGRGVGPLLRHWRAARGMSQLELALQAGFSPRHVSFIETGRSRPSRQALIALAEVLDMPLRDRNRLLEAAGFARVYAHTAFDAEALHHLRGVLQFIVERHAPFPAVVLDRRSTCLMANAGAARLLQAIADPALLGEQPNLLRVTFHPNGARRHIVNWPEVGRHLLHRAEQELGDVADDRESAALLAEIRGYAADIERRDAPTLTPADLLLPIHVRRDGLELRLFSTIMTLGTPRDVTLQELRIETFFAADEQSERAWTQYVG